MLLIIDNYDSFTYNLYQLLSEITDETIEVHRNDRISLEEIRGKQPSHIILSPGPGDPDAAGICLELVSTFAKEIPILGVCLGHQVIAQAFGGKIDQAPRIFHGKTDTISLDGKGLFRAVTSPTQCTRYHSLLLNPATTPDELEITAWTGNDEIMGVRHKEYQIEGVQFHPESIATDQGKKMLRNFLVYRRYAFNPQSLLSTLMQGESAHPLLVRHFMEELTEGNFHDIQIAAFLGAFGSSPEVEVLTAMAGVLREKAPQIHATPGSLDTCGTGGDGAGTHNISSLVALLAASGGVPVVKHGNRAVSSQSGSANIYQELGIAYDLSPKQAETLLKKTGFVFLFAPLYHQGMKYAAKVRTLLAVKSIMNLLGPLSNPASPSYHLMGVYHPRLLEPMARAAVQLGTRRVMTVHGHDGLDEVSVTGPTQACLMEEGKEPRFLTVDPKDYGIPTYQLSDLKGGSPHTNAQAAMELITGQSSGVLKDIVTLNAGLAFFVAETSSSIKEGIQLATQCLDSGACTEKLAQIKKESRELADGN